MYKNLEEFPQYRIYEDGRFYNENTGNFIKGSEGKNGYRMLSIYHDGKHHYRNAHRLLALYFIPNPEGKMCINHIDGNKLNNDLSNLEWCTYSENNKHAWDNIPRSKRKLSKKRFKHHGGVKVEQYTLCGKLLETFDKMKDAEAATGIHQGDISNCCRGKYKTAKGYIFKYAN